MVNLIFLGPPGAGKGTQATKLKQKYNVPHISTGDIFRENIKKGTELGKKAKEYMDKGELVPDSLVIEIVEARLLEDDCKNGFVLDGFPRTVHQARILAGFFEASGLGPFKVINLYVQKEALIKRLEGRHLCRTCNAIYNIPDIPPKQEGICDVCSGELYKRPDDNAQTIITRAEVYNRETKPLNDFYAEMGNIINIDGMIGLENVFAEIVKAIEA